MDREQLLDEVVTAYLKAVEAGQNPDPAEWLERHPDLADDLKEFFAAQRSIDRAAAPLRDLAPPIPNAAEAPTLAHPEAPTDPVLGVVRYFGDYELMEEIAHGGMGVVYKARQVSLNRVVALKMILAGAFASALDVQRFRTESEAAANLDHPNIVPIYEVGEHEGRHYYSMKFVEGGSLAQHLPRLAEDQRASARLIATAARAVHHAHQRGILHRDLKPGNVLVDAEGQPHLVDFGLAKRVTEGEQTSLTQVGTVLGTPSYMAPEQARAEKLLTTAVDVYALGAVLYELLTGRPPFVAAARLDIFLQVLDREPEPPRRLKPAVHRDLEAIVLKCLVKEPGRRYESAAALADDLDRWLDGKAVAARQLNWGERFAHWVRQNPGQFLLAFAAWMGLMMMVVVEMMSQGEASWLFLAVSGLFGAVFIAWLANLSRGQMKALEKRLRFSGPPGPSGGAAETGASPVELPAGLLRRRDVLRALGKGALNGALLGLGAAAVVQLELLSQKAAMWFRVAAFAVVLSEGALTGAVLAVLTRLFVRPFGPIAWVQGWLIAAVVVVLGVGDWGMLRELLRERAYLVWGFPLVALLAPLMDWWARSMRENYRRLERSGQLLPDQARLLRAMFVSSDGLIKFTPALLILAGTVAGHFLGAAAAPLGVALGGLIGELTGALLGGLLAMALLRVYRVEEGSPWPGHAGRPYPRLLAALYVAVTLGLFVLLLRA